MNIDIEDEEREKKFLWISRNYIQLPFLVFFFFLYFFVAMHLQNINKRGKLDKGLISSLK